MKKLLTLILTLFIIGSATVRAQKKETRRVDTFTKISYRIPGKLFLKQGGTQEVQIEGSPEMLGKIETHVQGGELIIATEEKWFSWSWKEEDNVTVYITVNVLEGVRVSGSGDVISQSRFTSDDFFLKVSGSGSFKGEVIAKDELKAEVSGSGDIEISGKCGDFESKVSGSGKVIADLTVSENTNVSISGSGKVRTRGTTSSFEARVSGSGEVQAADMESTRCEINIAGSGDVEINVKSELTARISGSGSIRYNGNPQKVDVHSSGSGKVKKMG